MAKRADNWTPSSGQRKARDEVARIFGIEPYRLIGRSRQSAIVWPRHTAMWVMRECDPTLSMPKIALLFGRSDHSTICYAIDKVRYRRDHDGGYRALTDIILDQIREQRASFRLSDAQRETVAQICDKVSPPKTPRLNEAAARKRAFYAEINSYPFPKPSTLNLQLRGEQGCPNLSEAEIEARRKAVVSERKAREAALLAEERQRYGLKRRATPLSEMVL